MCFGVVFFMFILLGFCLYPSIHALYFNELWQFLSPCFFKAFCASLPTLALHMYVRLDTVLSCCSVHYFLIFFFPLCLSFCNFYCCSSSSQKFSLQGLISFLITSSIISTHILYISPLEILCGSLKISHTSLCIMFMFLPPLNI